MIHVEAIAYFSANFNPQDQDTTARDEHLTSSDLLAPASYAAVLADARPAALLALACYAVVLADA